MKDLLLCAESHELEQNAALAAELGCGLQTQVFYEPEVLENPGEQIQRHTQLLGQIPGPIALHGPFFELFPGSRDPLVREVARKRILQGIGIAAELNASHIVFHPNCVPGWFTPENWLKRCVPFWREILEHAPQNMRIHLENVMDPEPQVLLSLVEQIDDPRAGICLDIGHAHLFSAMPVVEWVHALSNRITLVHIHDNDQSGDQHLPLGKGTLPVESVLQALQEAAPEATWVIEEGQARDSLAWLGSHGFWK